MDVEKRLADLEAEVKRLRDMEEIRHLLSTYAFNADLGRAEEYLDGWTDDGVYDLSETMRFSGREELGVLLKDPEGMHKQMLENRSQHLVANLYIEVAGDTAWAEGYSLVTVARDGGFHIFTAAYNHWDFTRGGQGWLMTRRTRRVIGGDTPGGEVVKAYLG